MTVVFTDNFTGAVNTVINGRVGTGGTWSCAGVGANDIAGLKINASNQAKIATSNGCLGRIDTNTANHYAKANIWTRTSAAAVVVRAVDHLNFIGFHVTGSTQVELFRRIGGVETSVIKLTTAALTAPVSLQATINGTSVTLSVNGASIGAVGGYSVTDTVFTGVTKVGLWGRSSGIDPLADDFEAGTVAAAVASVAPANARSGTTDRNTALVTGAALGPAGSRLAGRTGSPGLGGLAVLVPARGVQAQRAGPALLSARLGIGPAGSKLAQGAGEPPVGPFPSGTATSVPGEPRTVYAAAEVRTIAVPHN